MPKVITRTVNLHPAQVAFRRSPARYRGLAGGRGAGKSWVGAHDLLTRCKPRRLYLAGAPTYPMLRDATWRTLTQQARALGLHAGENHSDLRLTLINGAEILGRSFDNPERARGPNLSGAWLDEASQMARGAFEVVIACLREQGEAGWLSATYTPRGKRHWTYEVFAAGKPDTAHFHARTADNPFVPPEFAESVRGQYTSLYAAQELEGQYVEGGGTLVRREWFKLVSQLPADPTTRVRYWDTAATEDGGAYTAGVLMNLYADRRFGIEDVVRGQWSAGRRDQVMRDTAELDRLRHGHVTIWREQEPGGSGKEASEAAARNLSGFDVHADRVTGDKVTRYQPFAAQVEAGNVLVKVAHWTEDYLDEQCAFPEGPYADQADASSGAFNKLAGGADWSQGIGVPEAHTARESSRPGVFRSGGRGGVFRS